VRTLLQEPNRSLASGAPTGPGDPTTLIIYGGGGHGKALIELVRAMRTFDIAGILDDGLPTGSQILGIPLLGGGEHLPALSEQGIRLAVNAVGGIGSLGVRVRVFERLAQAGFTCPAVVHPSAVIEASASLAAGVQIFAHAYVGSEARLGFGAIVNTGAIISHDCELGKFVNISPGAILAGEVSIGDGVLIGMGATINLRVHVGPGARIGNNATVKSDVPESAIVRAGAIWPA
jgi:sugar O-acyltransferase (sialic acid O-acetyltransferase NeuD family)